MCFISSADSLQHLCLEQSVGLETSKVSLKSTFCGTDGKNPRSSFSQANHSKCLLCMSTSKPNRLRLLQNLQQSIRGGYESTLWCKKANAGPSRRAGRLQQLQGGKPWSTTPGKVMEQLILGTWFPDTWRTDWWSGIVTTELGRRNCT